MFWIGIAWLIGAAITVWLGGLAVNIYLDRFAHELKAEHDKTVTGAAPRGFKEAGRLIGQLERFLIYLFVTAGYLEGVGFLVAAKSVFRFGELTNHHNRLEAEYITIGTLLSFSWGLAASLAAKLVIQSIVPGVSTA